MVSSRTRGVEAAKYWTLAWHVETVQVLAMFIRKQTGAKSDQ